jgi:DNA polymerase III epsilon subunit-like protein
MKNIVWYIGIVIFLCFIFDDDVGIILTIAVIVGIVFAVIKIISELNKNEKETTTQNTTLNLGTTYSTQPKMVNVDLEVSPSLTDKGLYLFLDVETTGLPEKYATPKNYDCFPRIVQFCWMVLDSNFDCVEHKNYYANFGGNVPYESTKIHGITTEVLRRKGIATIDVLNEFSRDLDTVKLAIAHNASFDLSIIQSEFYRHNMKNKLYRFPNFCTMLATTNICKVKRFRNGEYKYPKLEELFLYCNGIRDYDTKVSGVHDAEVDVLMTIYSLKHLIINEKINQIELLNAMKYYEKENSEFSQVIDAHIYILKKLKNMDKLDETKKLINKKMNFLNESNSVLFEKRIISNIENLY